MAKKLNTKSTVRNGDTVGKMLADTQQEHQKQQIEVGEFVEQLGKEKVMTEVWKQINERKDLPQWKEEKMYIVIWFRKSSVLNRVLQLFIHTRHTAPNPEPGLSCFSYEPKTNKLELEWVLPNKHAFLTFLKTEQYTDSFLIKCIKKYLAGQDLYKK